MLVDSTERDIPCCLNWAPVSEQHALWTSHTPSPPALATFQLEEKRGNKSSISRCTTSFTLTSVDTHSNPLSSPFVVLERSSVSYIYYLEPAGLYIIIIIIIIYIAHTHLERGLPLAGGKVGVCWRWSLSSSRRNADPVRPAPVAPLDSSESYTRASLPQNPCVQTDTQIKRGESRKAWR